MTEIRNLIDRWLETYNLLDKRTKEARYAKTILIKLFNMIGGDYR